MSVSVGAYDPRGDEKGIRAFGSVDLGTAAAQILDRLCWEPTGCFLRLASETRQSATGQSKA
jgi:hypothetical protein